MSKLTDGFSTRINFAASGASLSMEETEVTPPGISGGGENDTTTMANTTWRTKYPKSLKTLSNSSFTAAYDPADLNTLVAAVNVNQEIVITFPDQSTWTFWGWLDEFTPNALVEGEMPTASCTIIPSNMDGSNDEIAPAYSA